MTEQSLGSNKIERDFLFIKWFLSIATLLVVGMTSFLFTETIDNQQSIHEALIEIRNIKRQDITLANTLDRMETRFDQLATDPVHGWGQRWSRKEAVREIERQDRDIDRLTDQAEIIRDVVGRLQIDVNSHIAETTARLEGLGAVITGHVQLPAHTSAGNRLIHLQDQITHLTKLLDLHLAGKAVQESETTEGNNR